MNVKLIVCLCIVFGANLAAGKKGTTTARPDPSDSKQTPGNLEETYGEFDEKVSGDDFEDRLDEVSPPDDIEESKTVAKIRSKPTEFFKKLEDRVWLPCDTTSTDGVLLWKKDNDLFYQGPIAFAGHNNTKLHANGTLEIKLVSKNDFGTYTCQLIITQEIRPSVNHVVTQVMRPEIISVATADNRTVYKEGERLVLTCTTAALPKAKISWHKGNPVTANFDIQGTTFEIPSLKWSDAGSYRCLADNGIQPAAHDHIVIFVESRPVVTTDKYFINSDHKESSELRCIVHGYPTPKGGWKRNGENIGNSNKYQLTTKRHHVTEEYILIIKDLQPNDFGLYTCAAKNALGKDEKNVTLVRTPVIQDVRQPDQRDKDLVVTWKVDSRMPVLEHEFQFRKKGDSGWKTHEGSVNSTKRSDENGPYVVSYTAAGIEPGSYETRVRSRNEHGWSEYSDLVPFEAPKPGSSTHKHHKKHHKEKELKERRLTSHSSEAIPSQAQESEQRDLPVQAGGSSGTNLIASFTLTMASIILFFLHRNRQ